MTAETSSILKKTLVRMTAGAIVGATATFALLLGFDKSGLTLDDPARLAAAATGLCYALIGLGVGFGTLAPNAGAHFLNVEDAEELTEQRSLLVYSALSCILIGGLLIALAILPGGPTYAVPVAVVTALTVILFILLWIATSRHVDEMTRRVSDESSALAMQISFILFGGWAIMAHLGKASWISPIGLIAGLSAVYLLAIFVAAARRGLMTPR